MLDKLDYLKDLGINCIYFNPLFYSRSMHKYDGNSFITSIRLSVPIQEATSP